MPQNDYDKAALRRQAYAALRAQSPDDRRQKSDAIVAHLKSLLGDILCKSVPSSRVAGYLALPNEVDLGPLWPELILLGAELVWPWAASRQGPLYFVGASWPFPAMDGPWGARGPKQPLAQPMHAVLPDTILLPGLAFDAFGGRLGSGLGLFDRALQDHRGRRIGICFASQHILRLPQGPHDVACSAVVTEDGVTLAK